MISSSIKRCIIFDIDFVRHILKRHVDDCFDANLQIPYPLAISNIQRDLFTCYNHYEITVHCEEPRSSKLLIRNNSLFSILETRSLKFEHNLNLINCSISPFAEEFVKKEGL